MQERREERVTAGSRLVYRAPEITDLGSVVELTEAGSSTPTSAFDGTTYAAAGHS